MSFDLRAEIRTVLDTTDMTDPDEITEKVISAIPSDGLISVLRVTLRSYVQTFMGNERTRDIKFSGSDQRRGETHHASVEAGTDLDRGESGQVGDDAQLGAAAPPRSWKRDMLRARIHLGNQQRKLLGDCTVDDITVAAVEREVLSRGNAAWAGRYRKLAHRMQQYHADLVRELPYDMVAAILRGEPA